MLTISVIAEQSQGTPDEDQFAAIISRFMQSFLVDFRYNEKLNNHRQPLTVMYDAVNDLFGRIRQIQHRPILQDIDPENKASQPATTTINDLWKADKNLRTLYHTVLHFCALRGLPPRDILFQIAEYRAVYRLANRIRHAIRRRENKGHPPLGKGVAPHSFEIIDPAALLTSMQEVANGQVSAIEATALLHHAYPTQPLPSYTEAAGHPVCCNYHGELLDNSLTKFSKFPDCCTGHRRLPGAPWFDKSQFGYMPLKVVDTLCYTLHFIYEHMDTADWQAEITHYIDYTIRSYGQLPHGYGPPPGIELYIEEISALVNNADNLSLEKKQAILDYIDGYKNSSRTSVEATDLNLLIDCYRRWLKIFPFELEFFATLKPYFESRLFLLKGEGNTNPYTGLTGYKIKSQPELMQFLHETTATILETVNSQPFYEQGQLTDIRKTQLAILNAKRNSKAANYTPNGRKERGGYVKLLKEWFADEKEYLTQLKKLLTESATSTPVQDAITHWIRGLQQDDTLDPCISKAKNNKPLEADFQISLRNALRHRFPKAEITLEPIKGNGRIDVRFVEPVEGTHIIELKGWWNQRKEEAPEQLCSYLTDFERYGHIVLINDSTTGPVSSEYKEMVTQPAANYIHGSWKEHTVANSNFRYFESRHRFTLSERTLYHFILDIHASNPTPKRPVAKRKRK